MWLRHSNGSGQCSSLEKLEIKLTPWKSHVPHGKAVVPSAELSRTSSLHTCNHISSIALSMAAHELKVPSKLPVQLLIPLKHCKARSVGTKVWNVSGSLAIDRDSSLSRTKSMSYLNSLRLHTKVRTVSKLHWTVIQKPTREPPVKVVDILIVNLNLFNKVLWIT